MLPGHRDTYHVVGRLLLTGLTAWVEKNAHMGGIYHGGGLVGGLGGWGGGCVGFVGGDGVGAGWGGGGFGGARNGWSFVCCVLVGGVGGVVFGEGICGCVLGFLFVVWLVGEVFGVCCWGSWWGGSKMKTARDCTCLFGLLLRRQPILIRKSCTSARSCRAMRDGQAPGWLSDIPSKCRTDQFVR